MRVPGLNSWAMATLAMAVLLVPSLSALAFMTCPQVLGEFRAPPIIGLPPWQQKQEFQYVDFNGHTLYYRDGCIWQLRENVWIHIGYGYIRNGVVHPNETGFFTGADLSPVKNYKYQVFNHEGEKFYPNLNRNLPSLIHTLEIGNHKIEILIPKDSGYAHAADGIIRAVAELPLKKIEALKTLRLNTGASIHDPYWIEHYKNFTESWAGAADGQIDIYKASLGNFSIGDSEAVRLTRHEFGHLIASQVFGSVAPTNAYLEKAQNDKFYVSEYGNNSWAEDFAEGIEVYLRTNAGQWNPLFRSQLAHRFSFFDDVFNERTPQSEKLNSRSKKRPEMFITMISKTEIFAIAPQAGIGLLLKLN